MILPIPISDEPNPPEVAWATYALIAVNVAVFVAVTLPAQLSAVSPNDANLAAYIDVMVRATAMPAAAILQETTMYDLILFRWGFRPAAPSVLALLTSQFLHAGILHLGGNMLYLYIFGDNVEAKLGRVRFVLMYLAGGVAATLFYAATRPTSELPLLGASGAISGILGCYFIWFALNRVRLLVIIFIFVTTVSVPARLVLMFYFVVENLLPFLYTNTLKGGIAYGAHIGGFVAGALFARLNSGPLRGHGKNSSDPQRSDTSDAEQREEALLRTMSEASLGLALQAYQALSATTRARLSAKNIFMLVDRLTEAREFDEALRILDSLINDTSARASLARGRAHIRAGYIHLHGLRQLEVARRHFLAALEDPMEDLVIEAAEQGLQAVQAMT